MLNKRFPYKSAYIACNGGCANNPDKLCKYGCTGCGKCVEACSYGFIKINENGIAEVDESSCRACSSCSDVCPRNLIHIHEVANNIRVKCSNRDKGADARKVCAVSCIGCGICEKNCPAQAIRVSDNLSVIDESLCLSCGMCAVLCPRKAIRDVRGLITSK